MNILLIRFVMFIGSRLGLLLLILFVMLLVLLWDARQKKKQNDNLAPRQKSKFRLVLSTVLVLFYFFFVVFVEPDITMVEVDKAEFDLNDQHYTITKEEDPEGVLAVKWQVYKWELMMNLGLNGDSGKMSGDLNLRAGDAVIIKHEFPLGRLLEGLDA